jgi:hypothetical protein
MRAILIHGDGDYSATEFENEHGGTSVYEETITGEYK